MNEAPRFTVFLLLVHESFLSCFPTSSGFQWLVTVGFCFIWLLAASGTSAEIRPSHVNESEKSRLSVGRLRGSTQTAVSNLRRTQTGAVDWSAGGAPYAHRSDDDQFGRNTPANTTLRRRCQNQKNLRGRFLQTLGPDKIRCFFPSQNQQTRATVITPTTHFIAI